MKLFGMLDSPYVRRVAISLQLLGLRFEHQSLSVFRGFDAFRRINPVVKAPTLVCDDGEVLMDSTLMLDLAEALARPRTLMPAALPQRQHALRLLGLALAACEKSVQIVYEHGVRPPEKLHEPWVTRVTGQMLAAFDELEQELAREPLDASTEGITQAGVTAAVTWFFVQMPAARAGAGLALPATGRLLGARRGPAGLRRGTARRRHRAARPGRGEGRAGAVHPARLRRRDALLLRRRRRALHQLPRRRPGRAGGAAQPASRRQGGQRAGAAARQHRDGQRGVSGLPRDERRVLPLRGRCAGHDALMRWPMAPRWRWRSATCPTATARAACAMRTAISGGSRSASCTPPTRHE